MRRGEKGFTVIELLMVVAITGVIIAPLTMATITLLTSPQRFVNQGIVLRQVQNAGYWLSRDVQMARSVNATDSDRFLTLTIPVSDNISNDYTIEYVFEGSKLKREEYDSAHILVAKTFIADYIDTYNTTFSTVNTTFSTVDIGVYELRVKAVKDKAAVTRSYEIKQRLSLGSE